MTEITRGWNFKDQQVKDIQSESQDKLPKPLFKRKARIDYQYLVFMDRPQETK